MISTKVFIKNNEIFSPSNKFLKIKFLYGNKANSKVKLKISFQKPQNNKNYVKNLKQLKKINQFLTKIELSPNLEKYMEKQIDLGTEYSLFEKFFTIKTHF